MKLGIPTLVNYEGVDDLCRSAEHGSLRPTGYVIVDNGGGFSRREPPDWCQAARARGATVEVHTPGRNLGVAASWNWILARTLDDGGVIVANDDVLFGQQTFEDLVRGMEAYPFVLGAGWACFGQRADCTLAVGFYDERFWPAYYEDNDYQIRMHAAGIAYPTVVTERMRHAEWTTTRALDDPGWLREGRERNRQYLLDKWSPDGASWPTHENACERPFRGSPPPGWAEGRLQADDVLMRWDILNAVAEQIGATRYLEVGVSDGGCMGHVRVAEKWGIDPFPHPDGVKAATMFCTRSSDWFWTAFAPLQAPEWDLVFIDGEHIAEQVYRDVQGALAVLSPGGVICLHDCNPSTEAMQRVPAVQGEWTGDCWRAVARLRSEGEHTVRVVNSDYGVGIILPRRREARIALEKPWHDLEWADLEQGRERLLGLLEPAEWQAWLATARK
jgi:GT2 family glycosyltransferase